MKPHDDLTIATASAFHAAGKLGRLIRARSLFPGDLANEQSLRAFRTLVDHLEVSLKHDAFGIAKDWYERPHIENADPPECLGLIQTLGFMLLAEHRGLPVSEADEQKLVELSRDSHDFVSDELREALRWLDDEIVFNCRFPHPNGNSEFDRPERFLFLLGLYLDLYNQFLQLHGDSPIFYSPHPMIRYIENLRFRIRFCLDQIGDHDLARAIHDMLQIEFDWDSNAVWEDWAQPIIAKAFSTFEKLRTSKSIGRFELVEAEQQFEATVRACVGSLRQTIEAEWRKMLKKTEKMANTNMERERPRSCFDYIREVETKLRELSAKVLESRLGSEWWDKLRDYIDHDAYQSAVDTMRQRDVDSMADLLHFMQLKDVYNLISQQWSYFDQRFSCVRKEFNRLMQPILKGRTEEAHNRPDHLWPQIEQDRVKVACHDLLSQVTPRP